MPSARSDLRYTLAPLTHVTEEEVRAFARLLPQLSASAAPPTLERLRAVVAAEACTLLVARQEEDGRIVGAATLTICPLPTGLRAWIEDVVVDADARGQGLGEALVRALLERAAARGVPAVDLTSRPARAAANRLYRRMGFAQRETNAYRYRLAAEQP